MNPVPIAVIGPTATGKSALALDLAEALDGEIVNCDAMARYLGMDIGTAKPPLAARRGIIHHQLDVLPVTATASVADFQAAARGDVEAIMARGRRPVIAGGSMLYVQALLDDWQFPPTDPQLRAELEAQLGREGISAMHAHLAARDPEAAATILPTDARRIVRALEVGALTGLPFAASQPRIGEPRWGAVILGVDRDTSELDERIARRTDAMFAGGLIDEVAALVPLGLREGQTARRAIGYAQALAHLDGELSLEAAREATFIGTRRYVRRQRSWFRRDHRVRWLDGAEVNLRAAALALVAGDGRGKLPATPSS